MSVEQGVANEYAADIRTDLAVQEATDPYNSHIGFIPQKAEIRTEYGSTLAEMDRSPMGVHAVFSECDADEKLFRDAIRQRQGFRRAFRTARDAWQSPIPPHPAQPGGAVPGGPANTAVPLAPGFLTRAGDIMHRVENVTRNLAREGFGFYGTYDVIKEHWITKVALSAGGRAILSHGLQAVGVAGGPLGAISAAVPGGIWGYIRGKNQTEAASTWMSELGILKMSVNEIREFDESRLERTLGILKNAVDEGRVRGHPEQKVEMACKIRLIKNRLAELRNEANDRGDELNPVLQRIEDSLTSENQIAEEVSRMAGEKYKDEFKEIIGLKKNKVLMSIIKGAVVAGTVGGIFGFVQEHGGISGTVDWVKDKLHGIGHDFSGGGTELSETTQHALDAKQQLLEHSSGIQNEIAQHNSNMDQLGSLHNDLPGGTNLANLSPDQLNALNHYEHLQSMAGQGASVDGFAHNFTGDMGTFNGLLHNGNLHEMVQMTNVHNLDLNTMLPNGEHFGQYLVENKETFLQFSPQLQSFILEHPSVAPEFMNITAASSEQTIKAIIDRYSVVLGAAALGGAIGLFVHAHRGQKKADLGVWGVHSKGFATARSEMMAADQPNSITRRAEERSTQVTQGETREDQIETNRAASIQAILSAESVTFVDRNDPRYADLRGINFHVDGVDRDANNRETTMVLRALTQFPRRRNFNNIDVNTYLDDTGNIRRNMITLRTLADTEREREATQREFERFVGRTILGRFAGGSVFVPDATSVATLGLPPEMVTGINVVDHTIWPIGLDMTARLIALRSLVGRNPVYSASAECTIGTIGNYVYKEGYPNTPNPNKKREIDQIVKAGAGEAHLLYISNAFYSVVSVAKKDVTLRKYAVDGTDLGTGVKTTDDLGSAALCIFDRI